MALTAVDQAAQEIVMAMVISAGKAFVFIQTLLS
jgi:hypothetical protein